MSDFEVPVQLRLKALAYAVQVSDLSADPEDVAKAAERFERFLLGHDSHPQRIVLGTEEPALKYTYYSVASDRGIYGLYRVHSEGADYWDKRTQHWRNDGTCQTLGELEKLFTHVHRVDPASLPEDAR